MEMTRKLRVGASLAGLVGAGLALSGCVGGPTYGTDKTATEQLMDDIGNAVTIRPGNGAAKTIAYQPRGQLVLPKDETKLAQPQQSLAGKDNPQWVESPEQMRERLREEATLNQNNQFYESPLTSQFETGRKLSAKEQQEKYREARRLEQGLYSDKRRTLSDPPIEYRKMPEEAQADLGEPEKDKERRRKKEASIAKTGKSPWWPF
ncbi:hypothetical protein [Sinorhizobium sp. BG8]|uniref:hypothetical protein n=1 Tax=Sinorhizobium sp. BG8 TaxID=2613773 RepID=UPI00193D2F44|nr:hypothetical protein [Sinorhizobium sp. BG8]QRM54468.1 hypothetical protein F3Y30_07855 [Sinorhizobium sp. BG8]